MEWSGQADETRLLREEEAGVVDDEVKETGGEVDHRRRITNTIIRRRT